jgi:hypothetical protein
MKQVILLLSMCVLLLRTETARAQTASDYYTPLGIGSHVTLHTTGAIGPDRSARTTTYSIEGSDIISGHQYFMEIGAEYADPVQAWTSNTFRVLWLRKDSVGNVVLGAMSTTGSANIDSATVFNYDWFPNEFLTKGFSRTYPQGKQTYQDSVLSVTETVSVPAGTFTNCLKISDTHFDSTGTAVFREYHYYARGIGLVENIRTLPESQIHTDVLMEYGATAVANPLYGTWIKTSGPSDVVTYNFISNSDVTILVGSVLYTAKYVIDTSVTPHHISWYAGGKLANLGIWSISGNTLTVKASGGDTITFPSSFTDASTYTKQATGVGNNTVNQITRKISLSVNSPNPFSSLTDISFTLASASCVSLKVFDLSGREVATLVNNEMMPAGTYTKRWNGGPASSGVYLYRLAAGSSTKTTKAFR